MRVFNRPVSESDPSRQEFAEWMRDGILGYLEGDYDSKVAARNLSFDHRVSDVRERDEFGAFVRGPEVKEQNLSFDEAISYYHQHNIRKPLAPAFNTRHNLCNDAKVKPDVELVSVLDLTGLYTLFKDAGIEGVTAELNIADLDHCNRFLTERFRHSDIEKKRDFLSPLLSHVSDKLFQPTWAGLWQEFEAHVGLDSNPGEWMKAYGMARSDSTRWLVLLRYRAGLCQNGIFRPTVLEAVNCPYHYPSPPCLTWPVERGGISLDLRDDPHPTHSAPPSSATTSIPTPVTFLSEFIHSRVKWDKSHIVKVEFTERAPANPDVQKVRDEHYNRLKNRFPDVDWPNWMTDLY